MDTRWDPMGYHRSMVKVHRTVPPFETYLLERIRINANFSSCSEGNYCIWNAIESCREVRWNKGKLLLQSRSFTGVTKASLVLNLVGNWIEMDPENLIPMTLVIPICSNQI